MESIDGYDHLCMSLCIFVFCYWWYFGFVYIWLLMVLAAYCCVILLSIRRGYVLGYVLACVYVCLFCVLCFLLLVLTHRPPMRALWDSNVVVGSQTPFCTYFLWFSYFCEICLILYSFLLALGMFVPFWVGFLIFNGLVASLYVSRIWTIENLSMVLISIFHNTSTSYVQCCAYLIHLNIDFWC